jgi:uncharacterized protein
MQPAGRIGMQFEWDPQKATANERQHGVAFQEAATVFFNPLAFTFSNPDRSFDEDRYMTFVFSKLERLLVVSHTSREHRTRIISAPYNASGEEDL